MNDNSQKSAVYKNYPVDKKTLIDLQERADIVHQGNPAFSATMIVELIIMIIMAMIIALSINRFLFRVVRVDGSSMFATFISNERVLTERFSYNVTKLKRGDVIICTYKRSPNSKGTKAIAKAVEKGKEVYYDGPNVLIGGKELNDSNFIFERVIKRVIGLPGETIEIIDGIIYLNGEKHDESAYWNDRINNDISAVTIPRDEYFVVGDNRNHSGDSRYKEIGTIPFHRIQGQVLFKIWPISSIGSFQGKN